MKREEEEAFQRLIEEADAAHDRNFVAFIEGIFIGIFLMIAWEMLPC